MPKINSTLPCAGVIHECVEDAYCDVIGTKVCKCRQGFYPKSGLCTTNIAAGLTCEGVSVNECVENAACVDGICTCDAATHYNHYGKCQIYLNATEPCENLDNECVSGATCQAGLCACADNLYVEFGQCAPIKDAGAPCSGLLRECTSHSSCVIEDLVGMCMCDAGYYDR